MMQMQLIYHFALLVKSVEKVSSVLGHLKVFSVTAFFRRLAHVEQHSHRLYACLKASN